MKVTAWTRPSASLCQPGVIVQGGSWALKFALSCSTWRRPLPLGLLTFTSERITPSLSHIPVIPPCPEGAMWSSTTTGIPPHPCTPTSTRFQPSWSSRGHAPADGEAVHQGQLHSPAAEAQHDPLLRRGTPEGQPVLDPQDAAPGGGDLQQPAQAAVEGAAALALALEFLSRGHRQGVPGEVEVVQPRRGAR